MNLVCPYKKSKKKVEAYIKVYQLIKSQFDWKVQRNERELW